MSIQIEKIIIPLAVAVLSAVVLLVARGISLKAFSRWAVKTDTAIDDLIIRSLVDPAPFVRFIPGFWESSLDFTLICQVREFVDQYLVQHELRKRIFKRFKGEGIKIPFLHRTVYLREEKEWQN
jgi:small-conductance mechanosensitive channel